MTRARTVLAPDEIRGRLARSTPGIRRAGERVRGDHDMNPDLRPMPPLRPAAVLVPIVMHGVDPTVLLTLRSPHLADHAGQISFPGGRLEPDDPDAAAAALREAEEEIGLRRMHVEIVGRIDTYQTRTGYEVTPVVGLVSPPFELALDASEVAAAFEVPLAFLVDRRNHRRETRQDRGITRSFWAIPFGEHYIWGATAGMLVNLAELLGAE